MKKRVLILSFSWLECDPRLFRQITWVKDEHYVVEAGFSSSKIDNVDSLQIKKYKKTFVNSLKNAFLMKLNGYENVYWSNNTVKDAYGKLRNKKFDIIIANDIETLPLSVRLAKEKKAKLFFDAHEYAPRDFDNRWTFRFFKQPYRDWICRKYLPFVDAMSTVCEGIAVEYTKKYNVKCDVILSAPFFENLHPSSLSQNKIKLIHHGSLNKSRKIEYMIELMDKLDDRFYLDFMLVSNDQSYLRKIQLKAAGNSRIRFRDPVSMTEISKTINCYDIGLFMLWPGAFSYKMALPNKFFEFVQGRLAIAIWPSPEMVKLVNEYDLGIVSDDFSVESMAEKLNAITKEDIVKFKSNAHKAANSLCAEKNGDKLLDIVNRLIG
jgi:glycosyltransferase involved in cell wall biosynthesis